MARPRHFSGKLNRQNRIFAYSTDDSLPMSIPRWKWFREIEEKEIAKSSQKQSEGGRSFADSGSTLVIDTHSIARDKNNGNARLITVY